MAYLSRRSFFRFLAAYGIFLLLLLSLMLPMVIHASRALEQSNLEVYAEEAKKNIQHFDERMESLMIIVQRMAREEQYAVLMGGYALRNGDYLVMRQAQLHLADVAGGFSFVRDMGLITDSGLILTRFRSYPPRDTVNSLFYGENFSVSGLDTLADFQKKLTGAPFCARVQSLDYGSYDALVLSLPLTNEKMLHKADAFIVLDLNALLADCVPVVFAREGSLRLTDARGNFLWAWGNEALTDPVEISGAASRTGLQFFFSAPRAAVLSRVSPLIRAIYLSLLCALGGGLILIVVFSWRNHLPLRRLSMAAQALSRSGPEGAKTEYEYLSKTLVALDESMRCTEDQLKEQSKQLQMNLLEKAMLGSISSPQNLLDFRRLLPDFPETYAVALLLLPREATENSLNYALSRQLMVEHMLSQQFDRPMYHLSLTGNLIVLVVPQELDAVPALERFREAFTRAYQMPLNIYVSDPVSGVDSLSEAYSQAKRVQRLGMAYEGDQVWVSGNFPQQDIVSSMDYTVLQQLYEAITAADVDTALASLNRLRVLLPDRSGLSEGMTAIAFRKVLEFLLSILIRIKQEHFSVLRHVTLYYPDLNQPLDAYFATLAVYVRELCATLAAARLLPANFGDKIVSYIDQNLTNPDLYQKTVTSYFHITEHTLQSVMRERTGASFADYIEQKRLDLAHRMLVRSNESVQDIARQSGFSLYNTFYKAFKRRWGCSPSEYRQREQSRAAAKDDA